MSEHIVGKAIIYINTHGFLPFKCLAGFEPADYALDLYYLIVYLNQYIRGYRWLHDERGKIPNNKNYDRLDRNTIDRYLRRNAVPTCSGTGG